MERSTRSNTVQDEFYMFKEGGKKIGGLYQNPGWIWRHSFP